jgi:hypothetical protein
MRRALRLSEVRRLGAQLPSRPGLTAQHHGTAVAVGGPGEQPADRTGRRVTTSNADEGFASVVERFILPIKEPVQRNALVPWTGFPERRPQPVM